MDLSAPYGIKYIQLGIQALSQKKQRVVLNEDSSCIRFSISTSSIQNEATTNRQMTILKGNESEKWVPVLASQKRVNKKDCTTVPAIPLTDDTVFSWNCSCFSEVLRLNAVPTSFSCLQKRREENGTSTKGSHTPDSQRAKQSLN